MVMKIYTFPQNLRNHSLSVLVTFGWAVEHAEHSVIIVKTTGGGGNYEHVKPPTVRIMSWHEGPKWFKS